MDPAIVTKLDDFISQPRMAPYIAGCGGDQEKARRLYLWNMEISAAFWGAISSVEVAMRNALHREFAQHFGRTDWWHDRLAVPLAGKAVTCETDLLSQYQRQSRTYRSQRPPPGPDDVVANLSFGFWSTMVASPKSALEQDKYWHLFAHRSFPNWGYRPNDSTNRGHFTRRLESLRKFRNRVAHHEPIHTRQLDQDNRKLIDMARFVDIELAHFVNGHSRVATVLSRRSAATEFGDCCF